MKITNFVAIVLCAVTATAPTINAQILRLGGQSGIPGAPPVVMPGVANSPAVQQAMLMAQAAPAVVPEKKPGMVRVGVITPAAQMGQTGQDVAGSLQALLVQYLSGPMIEVTPILARMPQQIEAEAKQKTCDYLLSSSLSQKTGGSGLGGLRAMSSMVSMIPMVGMVAGMGGAIASAAAGAALSGASGLGGLVKAKSEVTFNYNLAAPGKSAPVITKVLKAKAKSDGEDLITPLITQAVTEILAEVSKNKPQQ